MMNTPRSVSVFEPATKENFHEHGYLKANRDVAEAVASGAFKDGYQHFKRHGQKEGRKQLKTDFVEPIRTIRADKAKRIEAILKPGIAIEKSEDNVFDYLGDTRKEQFGFSETDNISSNAYDETPLHFIDRYPEGLILDCGAGYRSEYYENVVNYEIVPYPTTDVLGFAEDLPFADDSFDAVFSFAVLEHVKYPFRAASELCRVLKPGGSLVVGAAFLQPVHGYPHHYFNMTNLGLQVLFQESIEIDQQFVNPGTGPVVALSWFLREWLNGLPQEVKKDFCKMRLGDFTGRKPETFFAEPFVNRLDEQTTFKLACATRMIGTKKPGPRG